MNSFKAFSFRLLLIYFGHASVTGLKMATVLNAPVLLYIDVKNKKKSILEMKMRAFVQSANN